jgi:hypothetical protein
VSSCCFKGTCLPILTLQLISLSLNLRQISVFDVGELMQAPCAMSGLFIDREHLVELLDHQE